jgi:N-acetylglucosamine-6-sulfatase
VRYPHGDGGPDRHGAELYHLDIDPLETRNLLADPSAASELGRLRQEFDRLMRRHKAAPDRMPMDGGIRTQLPRF